MPGAGGVWSREPARPVRDRGEAGGKGQPLGGGGRGGTPVSAGPSCGEVFCGGRSGVLQYRPAEPGKL